MATPRKDPSDKKSVPSRDNSKMDSEEQEFWNLGEGGDNPLNDPLDDDLDELDAPGEPAGPVDEIEVPQETVAAPAGSETTDAPAAAPAPEDAGAPSPPSAPEPDPKRPPAGTAEKISLIILAAVLLIGAIWGAIVFIGSMPEGSGDTTVDFPVKGSAVTIAAADTYWRKPDREKDKGIRVDTRLVPAAIIKLKNNDGNCALRFFFSDDNGELVGDPTTHSVAAGTFTTNGANNVEVHGTAGFADPGDHAAYTTEQIDIWHLVIMEGPNANARGSEFKQIAKVPISFDLR